MIKMSKKRDIIKDIWQIIGAVIMLYVLWMIIKALFLS